MLLISRQKAMGYVNTTEMEQQNQLNEPPNCVFSASDHHPATPCLLVTIPPLPIPQLLLLLHPFTTTTAAFPGYI